MPASLSVIRAEELSLREAIFSLRYSIYVEEMGKSPSQADHDRRWLIDEFDDSAVLYALQTSDGQLVGTLRRNTLATMEDPLKQLAPMPLVDLLARAAKESITYTSRLMLQSEWRGGSALGQLFNRCYGDCLDEGIRFDICHSTPGLVGLYEQLGYRRFCTGLDWPGIGYQVPMIFALRDKDYLRKSRSPLLRHPAVSDIKDERADGLWLEVLSRCYKGLNHRIVGPDEFWSSVEKSLYDNDDKRSLFYGLSSDQARRLLSTGTVLQCVAGDQILSQQEVHQDLFVLLEGNAEVFLGKGEDRLSLALLSPGDAFGEMGFVGRRQRSADVVAATYAEVLVLTQAFLAKAICNQPEAAAILLRNLAMVLADRLANTTDRLWHCIAASESEESI